MKKLIAILIAVASVAAVCAVDAAPYRQTFTMLSNDGTSQSVAAIYNSAATAQRVDTIVFGATTGTVNVAVIASAASAGAVTSIVYSKVVTSTDKHAFVTNMPLLFVGDAIRFTGGDRTTNTCYIIGEEF